MLIDKVEWITAHNCGKTKWHSFRENLGPRHCLTKCALENKLLNQNCWSWYQFSQKKLPHTLIPLHPHNVWSICRSVFYGPPCIFPPLYKHPGQRDHEKGPPGSYPNLGQTDPEYDQLADLTNKEVRLTKLLVIFQCKFTDFWVTVGPELSLTPMDPFRITLDPGVFRVDE